jgi:hypothetical protein
MYPKDEHVGGFQVNRDWLLGVMSKHNNEKFDDCRTPPPLKHNETALVDSGFTGHFLLSNVPGLNKTLTTNPLTVRLQNGQTMKSTHTATLDIPQLSKSSRSAHIFPDMENNSLLSVGQLSDEGYFVLVSIDEVKILNEKQKLSWKETAIVPQDYGESICITKKPNCNIAQKLPQIHSSNNVYALRNTGALVKYLHKAMSSCTKYDLVHAVKKGHLETCPGLTVEAINKHLKLTAAFAMGHMN